MKTFLSSSLLCLLSFLVLSFGSLRAESTGPKKLPFHGKLESMDAAAQTITLSGKSARIFHLTPATKITDGAGSPSTLNAATAGEDVGGSYIKGADGTLTLYSVRFGAKTGSAAAATAATTAAPEPPITPTPMPAAKTTPSPKMSTPTASEPAPMPAAAPAPAATADPKKQRFTGKVVSVNAAGNTLVVHGKADQTFTVSAATKMTGASTLADLTVGSKVSGTYMKATDGTLNVATLKAAK